MPSNKKPPYPPAKSGGKIVLPEDKDKELLDMLVHGKRIEAMQKVMELTAAGLKMSKDYLDNLARHGK